jgi:histidine ammonia-lyase
VRIDDAQLRQLQTNLVRSHAAGVGAPLSVEQTRMLLALRINVLAKGHSGIRPESLQTLLQCLRRNCISRVPEQGTVGASGDLAPLSHLALGMLGEGLMWHPAAKEYRPAGAVLSEFGIAPLVLEAKEGLALINGTQLIVALGCEAVVRAKRIARQADVVAALTVEALRGSTTPFHPFIHQARPHRGQGLVAARMRDLLGWSRGKSAIASSHANCSKVQDSYTLRCIPQVHGIVTETVHFVYKVLLTEMNSATDNPMVFPWGARGDVEHLSAAQLDALDRKARNDEERKKRLLRGPAAAATGSSAAASVAASAAASDAEDNAAHPEDEDEEADRALIAASAAAHASAAESSLRAAAAAATSAAGARSTLAPTGGCCSPLDGPSAAAAAALGAGANLAAPAHAHAHDGAADSGADSVPANKFTLQGRASAFADYENVEEGIILSGGNFHGEYPAKVLDYLAIAVQELAAISERRIERLVNGHLSGLPPFLVPHGGLNSGFMIAHCTAAALVSENKGLCHPASVDSISTSAAQEDHVSMGGWAARKAVRVVTHVEQVLAIELLCAAQAIDFLRPLTSTPALERVHAAVRAEVAPWSEDRYMAPDIAAAHGLIKEERVWAAVRAGVDRKLHTFVLAAPGAAAPAPAPAQVAVPAKTA